MLTTTIVALFVAGAVGLLAGLVAALRQRTVARDVLAYQGAPSPWQRQLAAWNRIDAERRRTRDEARAERADTLRGIYLADVAAAAEQPEEVPAR